MSAHPAHPLLDPAPTGTDAGGGVDTTTGTADPATVIDPRRVRKLQQALGEMIGALGGEIEAILEDPRHGAIPVGCGRLVSRDRQRAEYEVSLRHRAGGLRFGDEVGYEVSGAVHSACIVGVRSATVRLAVGSDLGDIMAPGLIRRDTAWLVDALRTTLREISAEVGRSTPLGERFYRYAPALLGLDDVDVGAQDPDPQVLLGGALHAEQELAVRQSLGSQVLYLWGPPGTGKTLTLARIIEAHYRAGRRVLALGPSNISVDLLMAEVAERLRAEPGFDAGTFLRFGIGTGTTLSDDLRRVLLVPEVAPRLIQRAGAAESADPSRVTALETLQRQLGESGLDRGRRLQNAIDRCIVHLRLRQMLVDSRSPGDPTLLSAAGDQVIQRCRVLGTTLTQRYVSPRVMREHFDVVVIDEASMVSAPSLVAAARSARQVVIAGDFRQLPPVVLSRGVPAHRWLATDPFSLRGIPDDLERDDPPECLVMLTEQRRMAQGICDLIAPTYLGRLTTHSSVTCRATGPLGAKPLLWIDTGILEPRMEKQGSSRTNPTHATVVADVIRYMIHRGVYPGGHNVLVLAPFAAQAQLLERTVPVSGRPKVGTVHRIQGGEADVVILDLTDAFPGPISMYLQCDRPDHAGSRLLNVAVSRARQHIILVADFSFIAKGARTGAEVKRILAHFRAHGCPLSIAKLRHGLPDMPLDLRL